MQHDLFQKTKIRFSLLYHTIVIFFQSLYCQRTPNKNIQQPKEYPKTAFETQRFQFLLQVRSGEIERE